VFHLLNYLKANEGQLLLTSRFFLKKAVTKLSELKFEIMNQLLVKVGLRQQAIYVQDNTTAGKAMYESTSGLVANLAMMGYGVTQDLLAALNAATVDAQQDILAAVKEVMGMDKNWTPLVKGWHKPTGKVFADQLVMMFAGYFGTTGTILPCGHLVPENTFPIDQYNGCPFCGEPFQMSEIEYTGQGSKLKVLERWTLEDAGIFMEALLTSKTALDATQVDSLKSLLSVLPLPDVKIGMKETLMLVVDILIEQDKRAEAGKLFSSPNDILRYLWYKHTGFLQVIEPKTILKRAKKNNKHFHASEDRSFSARILTEATLKLKYNRQDCMMVATWLNNMEMPVEHMCESMHPKRGMWVRFIRALRLAEYSKREGFGQLRELLEFFYHEAYTVWNGEVSAYRLRADTEKTMNLLKQRPGLFARSLFANMLWFGKDATINAFREVMDKVPARLIITLAMYAENYFEKGSTRTVKPLGGVSKAISANKMLESYSNEELDEMKEAVAELSREVIRRRFAAAETENKTMFIDPVLFRIPLAIGDRSDNIQDMPVALQGTRFPVEGTTIRLFMQWGVGLKAQHLDMDLSCHIAYVDKKDICSFSYLSPFGCNHSGDIRSIPDKVGTAEYIDIDVKKLKYAGALYVTFTCNAYTAGSISPNLVVGWMDSRNPMTISERSGVAYDPSCVQHQVRIVNSLAKGLVFGVLDVQANEIVWLEMPFDGQIVQNLDFRNILALLKRLNSKMSIGHLLTIKAEAQGLEIVEHAEEADEIYSAEWARNTAAVTQLMID
jgi:hypothetical protein